MLVTELPREIAAGVTWTGGCVEFRIGEDLIIHGHVSTYLVRGANRSLMYDTGSPTNWSEVEAALDATLGDLPLDFVFLSHPELPHTGNLARLIEKYPRIQVVGDVRDYHLFFPVATNHLHAMVPGERIDLGGGTEFVVVEALIRDLPNTLWGYVPSAKTLFTADGLCYMHRPGLGGEDDDDGDPMHLPGECALITSELREPVSVENAAFFTGSALYWSRFVDDADERYDRVAALIEQLGVAIVAPTHGNVITDVADILATVRKGHRDAYRYGAASADAEIPQRSAHLGGKEQ